MLAVPIAGALVLGACSSDDGDDTGSGNGDGGNGGDLSGTVLLDGSSTVGPLAEVAAELFMEENPDVQVTVAQSGTSGGFEKFCIGENDMNNASREIKDSEIQLCGENDIGFEGVQVANDALAIVVNPDNPVECLTVDQLSQIWDEGSTVATWADVDGVDSGEISGESLTLYGPGTDSGTFDFFTEVINGESGKIRNDYTSIGEDDQAAIVAVEGDVAAMGYIPFSFVKEAGDKVKPLQIDGGDGCVEPSIDTVLDGTYVPLGRPLFTYASDTALEKPEVLAFIEFWIENNGEIAEAATYVPMSDAQVEESNQKVADLTA